MVKLSREGAAVPYRSGNGLGRARQMKTHGYDKKSQAMVLSFYDSAVPFGSTQLRASGKVKFSPRVGEQANHVPLTAKRTCCLSTKPRPFTASEHQEGLRCRQFGSPMVVQDFLRLQLLYTCTTSRALLGVNTCAFFGQKLTARARSAKAVGGRNNKQTIRAFSFTIRTRCARRRVVRHGQQKCGKSYKP